MNLKVKLTRSVRKRGDGRVGLSRRKNLVSQLRRPRRRMPLSVILNDGLMATTRAAQSAVVDVDQRIDAVERGYVRLASALREAEQELRWRYVDGLLPQMGYPLIDGNSVRYGGYTFRAAELFGIPEATLTMREIHRAGCPIKRIDIAKIGSSDIRHLTRWVEAMIKESGLAPPGFLEHVLAVARFISTYQLSWKSYLIWPEELLPEDILGKYVRDSFEKLPKDKDENELGALLLEEYGIWNLFLGLFFRVSEFDPDASLKLIKSVWKGRDPLEAATSSIAQLAEVYQKGRRRRLGWSIQTSGGLTIQTLNLHSLGVFESETGLPHPDPRFGTRRFVIRDIDWLKRTIIHAVENPGEQIRLATTIVGIEESRQGDLGKYQADVVGEIRRRTRKSAERRKTAEDLEILARQVAVHEINRSDASDPFYQSMVLSVAGESRQQSDGLLDRVTDILNTHQIRFSRETHPLEEWDNFLALLPDVRMWAVRRHTTLLPSLDAAVVFRRHGRPVRRKGALVGYYTQFRDPLVIPLGGNYLFTGTTGSGKSLGAEYTTYELMPLDGDWSFRIMDNTQAELERFAEVRAWRSCVGEFGGLVLFGAEIADPEKFRRMLAEVWDKDIRIVLFYSSKHHPELDEIWLDWLVPDIQRTGPGMVVVDETVNWFTTPGIPLAKKWRDLLNKFRAARKASITTIQDLGLVRKDHPGTHSHYLNLFDAGKFAFWTPHPSELPANLGVDPSYPEVGQFLVDTVASFKTDEMGPLRLPGYACFVGTRTAAEVKFEVDPQTLLKLTRKDMTATEEELWGK